MKTKSANPIDVDHTPNPERVQQQLATRKRKANAVQPMRRIRLTKEFVLQDDNTMRCLVLCGLGFSDRFIGEVTGLSSSGIQRIVSKVGLKRKFYRDGLSKVSRRVLSSTDQYVKSILEIKLSKLPTLNKDHHLDIKSL